MVDTPELVVEPAAAILPDSKTIYLIAGSPRNQTALPYVAKITWEADWNGLHISPEGLVSLLVSSTMAPSLGPQLQFMPTAIYWADGIAGRNDEDLRFRGTPVKHCSISYP